MKDMKFDNNKPRMDLIEPEFLEGIAKVLTLGASKYAPDSWKTQVAEPERRYYAAALRHLVAWKKGKKTDPESGLSHLHHAACNLMFLAFFDEVCPVPKSKPVRDPNRTNIKWSGVNHWVLKETFNQYSDMTKTILCHVYSDALAGIDLFAIEEQYNVKFKHIGLELKKAREDYRRAHKETIIFWGDKKYSITVHPNKVPMTVPLAVELAYEDVYNGWSITEVERQREVKFTQLGDFLLKSRDSLMLIRIAKEIGNA